MSLHRALLSSSRTKAFFVFMPVQGTAWIFAFLAFEGSLAAQYLFVVMTVLQVRQSNIQHGVCCSSFSTQGVFIFAFHAVNDPRVRAA